MLILRRKLVPIPYPEASGARVSKCRMYRYFLWRRWGPGKLLVFFMLNPSTADHKENDQTIRQCMAFAKRFGYEGILVINLFAYRTPDPYTLFYDGFREGEDNPLYIEAAMDYARRYDAHVVCAWGSHIRKCRDYTPYDVAWVKAQKVKAVALTLLADGTPGHPLYLSHDRELINL